MGQESNIASQRKFLPIYFFDISGPATWESTGTNSPEEITDNFFWLGGIFAVQWGTTWLQTIAQNDFPSGNNFGADGMLTVTQSGHCHTTLSIKNALVETMMRKGTMASLTHSCHTQGSNRVAPHHCEGAYKWFDLGHMRSNGSWYEACCMCNSLANQMFSEASRNHDGQRRDRISLIFLRRNSGNFLRLWVPIPYWITQTTWRKKENPLGIMKQFQWRKFPATADFCPLSWSNMSRCFQKVHQQIITFDQPPSLNLPFSLLVQRGSNSLRRAPPRLTGFLPCGRFGRWLLAFSMMTWTPFLCVIFVLPPFPSPPASSHLSAPYMSSMQSWWRKRKGVATRKSHLIFSCIVSYPIVTQQGCSEHASHLPARGGVLWASWDSVRISGVGSSQCHLFIRHGVFWIQNHFSHVLSSWSLNRHVARGRPRRVPGETAPSNLSFRRG